jgi:hypothetical protein
MANAIMTAKGAHYSELLACLEGCYKEFSKTALESPQAREQKGIMKH